MNIVELSPHYIRDYLLEKFKGSGKIVSGGRELTVPSIFRGSDYKRSLSINLETGLWQAFKDEKTGNFYQLVAELDGLSYKEAERKVLFDLLLRADKLKTKKYTELKTKLKEELNIGSYFEKFIPISINSYKEDNELILQAYKFIWSRKLFNLNESEFHTQFYVCDNGIFKDRLIIPFIKNNEPFYFQGRSLFPEVYPKYKNPEELKANQVLYPFDFNADYVVVCEGPLDTLSLKIHNINATCIMGSHISETQILTLREFQRKKGKIIMGYDADSAGRSALAQSEAMRLSKMMESIYTVSPPKKDWNEAHIQNINLNDYVLNNTKKYDWNFQIMSKLDDC